MADLRERLEGLAGRFPEREGMDGLEHRKRRRQLRGRVLAGTLALLIATVGTASAYFAFRDAKHMRQTDNPSDLPPNVGRIDCDGTETIAVTTEVRPQADGVHLQVRNLSQLELGYLTDGPGSGGVVYGLEPGVTEIVTGMQPGTNLFACFEGMDPEDPSRAPDVAREAIEVVDPEGLWISTELQCRNNRQGEVIFNNSTGGFESGPGLLVREQMADRIRETDVLERAGYEAKGTLIDLRLRRDDRTIAVFHVYREYGETEDRWRLGGYTACTSFIE